ncbi:MAG: PKD domain-containing protein, partial [Bacteroidales bacterium]|nr:PKD domain-containing protein [Bacteroidales bacterium]
MNGLFKVSLLVSITLLLGVNLDAQRTCAAHDHMLEQMEKNPRFKQKMKQIEQHTIRAIKNPLKATPDVITIPVHVIVVYANSQQNISNAQIQSQIDVLNKDYRKVNSDWNNTPSEFRSLVSDTKIEFTLQDIERHSNSKSSWGTNNAVKSSYPPYLPNTHLNVWVCNIGGGILGYAQFPGGAASTDGIVISPQYFGSSDYGSNFYLSSPFDKGRTATHEVGHWLNLRHIWGDGGCGATDYVDDTPDAASSNNGCPSHPHSSCGTNDMFMNYMDYVNDACMYMFTAGQTARMRAIFEPGGPRESFVSNTNPNTCNVTACNGNVSLKLVLDNYPSEVSWQLVSESGSAIDQGSGYSTKGQTINKSWNLPKGKYTFTINDSYGDGICCSEGNGSYTLKDGCNDILKSGGSYGKSERFTFCVENGGGGSNTPPVAKANGPYSAKPNVQINFSSNGSKDPDGSITKYKWEFGDGSTSSKANPSHAYKNTGTYKVKLTVTDNDGATGSSETTATISSSTNDVVLSFDDFENGFGKWTDGGGDCSLYSGSSYAYEGSKSINIRDNSGTSSSFYLTNGIDVTSFQALEVKFYFIAVSMESGEDFGVQYFDGQSWKTVAAYASGSGFDNDKFYSVSVDIKKSEYNFPTNMKIRFICDASSNYDNVYIDNVSIIGKYTSNARMSTGD